jgi:hypothetical protein
MTCVEYENARTWSKLKLKPVMVAEVTGEMPIFLGKDISCRVLQSRGRPIRSASDEQPGGGSRHLPNANEAASQEIRDL